MTTPTSKNQTNADNWERELQRMARAHILTASDTLSAYSESVYGDEELRDFIQAELTRQKEELDREWRKRLQDRKDREVELAEEAFGLGWTVAATGGKAHLNDKSLIELKRQYGLEPEKELPQEGQGKDLT